MNPDPTSLDNLRDIVEPLPVSWWPPAFGWWALLALILLALTVIATRAWRRWRANAYRREALRELESATSLPEIAETIKRTALAAFPRSDVASLSGPAWNRWLGETGGQSVPATVAQALTRGVFCDDASGNATEARAYAAQWIKNHHTPPTDPEGNRRHS